MFYLGCVLNMLSVYDAYVLKIDSYAPQIDVAWLGRKHCNASPYSPTLIHIPM